MDPIIHTIIAGLSLFIAYLWGYRQGARQGALEGMAAVIVFVKQKVGHILQEHRQLQYGAFLLEARLVFFVLCQGFDYSHILLKKSEQ